VRSHEGIRGIERGLHHLKRSVVSNANSTTVKSIDRRAVTIRMVFTQSVEAPTAGTEPAAESGCSAGSGVNTGAAGGTPSPVSYAPGNKSVFGYATGEANSGGDVRKWLAGDA
jgi:hypothetical protein